jgi:hypothetical protein
MLSRGVYGEGTPAVSALPLRSGRSGFNPSGCQKREVVSMSVSTTSEVWTTRALPILEAVRAHEGEDILDLSTLVEETGLPDGVVDVELKRLIRADYVSGDYQELMGGPLASFLAEPALTERGARCVGLWPSDDPYQLLLELLDRRIDEEDDVEEKTRWQRIRSGFGEVGKGAAAGLIVELVKAGSGVRF